MTEVTKEISLIDTVIVETMKENKLKHIYTENKKDFEIFDGITAINPFNFV